MSAAGLEPATNGLKVHTRINIMRENKGEMGQLGGPKGQVRTKR